MPVAIDISQWSGEVSVEDFQRAKAAGCSRVIVALNNLTLAKRQIDNAKAAGLQVQAYIYLYFQQDPASRVSEALNALSGTGVRDVWLDCEDETFSFASRFCINKLGYCADLVWKRGFNPGVYTASWWWKKHIDSTPDSELSTQQVEYLAKIYDLPLWDARWDNDPDIDPANYGAWTQPPVMSQYRGDTDFMGIWCDINSYAGVPGPSPAPEPEPAPAPEPDLIVLYQRLEAAEREIASIRREVEQL